MQVQVASLPGSPRTDRATTTNKTLANVNTMTAAFYHRRTTTALHTFA
jgi:hypothetical protein